MHCNMIGLGSVSQTSILRRAIVRSGAVRVTPNGGSYGNQYRKAEIHYRSWRHGCRMAACCAGAAAGAAGGRFCPGRVGRYQCALCGRVSQGPQRNRLHRGPERDGRVPLAGGPLRSLAGTDGRSGPPPGGRDRHARERARTRGQSCNSDDPDRFWRRRRPGPAWSCRQPRPARR